MLLACDFPQERGGQSIDAEMWLVRWLDVEIFWPQTFCPLDIIEHIYSKLILNKSNTILFLWIYSFLFFLASAGGFNIERSLQYWSRGL